MPDDPILRDSDETVELLRRAGDGDPTALDGLFERHRARLRRMVELRMPAQLRSRLDASDVIQEAYVDALRRLPDFVKTKRADEHGSSEGDASSDEETGEKKSLSFFLWLRWITRDRLMSLQRRHLGTLARDPRREIAIHHQALPGATSESLAAQLLGHLSTPSLAMVRVETKERLREILEDLDPKEREILSLRHFEQLSNAETAAEIGISEAAASKRYIRALTRLQGVLASLNLSLESLLPRSR